MSCPDYSEFVFRLMRVAEAALPWFKAMVVAVFMYTGISIWRR